MAEATASASSSQWAVRGAWTYAAPAGSTKSASPKNERWAGGRDDGSAPDAALGEALAGGAWLLGVCVGYQLLFEASEEFGVTDGLGLLPGRVTALPPGVPRPHIGWNRVRPAAEDGLFAGLGGEPWLYFVHGFAPEGVPDELVLATAVHGRAFPAAAGRGRVLGTQFHPEKSGEAGLAVLANFLAMSGGGEGGA
jgi:glutamine amidotransferase